MDNNSTYRFDFKSCFRTALKDRGLTQKAFAQAFALKASNLSGIINGNRKIPTHLINDFAEFLGIPESVLLNYQDNLKVSVNSTEDPNEVAAENILLGFDKIIYTKSLLKGLCDVKSPASKRLQILRDAYDLTIPDDLDCRMSKLSQDCFRKSEKTGMDKVAIATWVVRARSEAKKNPIFLPYVECEMEELARKLSEILHHNDTNEDTEMQIKDTLASYGIGYCCVPKESRASIDGYSFVLGDTPYIILTRRFDRIDNFAFNIMHELGHIALGHVSLDSEMISIAESIDDDDFIRDVMEMDADNYATAHLIPNRTWYMAPRVAMNPFVIQKKYTEWAISKGLNPWIVLGRVSHETGMYRFVSDDTRKVKSCNNNKNGLSMSK